MSNNEGKDTNDSQRSLSLHHYFSQLLSTYV
ncbi:hypothetical protein C8D84_10590 [Psychrobacter immobilis]|uniref:Uncharacterized protein n=1 Tax=Psychrobacter immobilis TaxID=498 RepID=A0A2V1ZX91_PSYIM|nr:hypothetical protein C8D84_10590 [Psychrobacter immobilis]